MKNQLVKRKNADFRIDGALATLRAIRASGIYFFPNTTATLRLGYISVTPNVCDEGVGISPTNDSPDQNRRLRCPRASKHSQRSASSQSSQHAAASKKKKLLLFSQLKLKQHTASTKTTFAGRALRIAPQNSIGPTALLAHAATLIPVSDILALIRACATRSPARMGPAWCRGACSKVSPC